MPKPKTETIAETETIEVDFVAPPAEDFPEEAEVAPEPEVVEEVLAEPVPSWWWGGQEWPLDNGDELRIWQDGGQVAEFAKGGRCTGVRVPVGNVHEAREARNSFQLARLAAGLPVA